MMHRHGGCDPHVAAPACWRVHQMHTAYLPAASSGQPAACPWWAGRARPAWGWPGHCQSSPLCCRPACPSPGGPGPGASSGCAASSAGCATLCRGSTLQSHPQPPHPLTPCSTPNNSIWQMKTSISDESAAWRKLQCCVCTVYAELHCFLLPKFLPVPKICLSSEASMRWYTAPEERPTIPPF